MTKRILLPIVMLLFIAQHSFAQNPEQHKDQIKEEVSDKGIQWAKDMTKKVDDICNLTKDQEEKIMAVNLRYADRLQELKAEKDLSADEMKSRKDKIMQSILSDYDPILTNEQKAEIKNHWDDFYGKD